ncbi:hypothetical protein EYR40_004811 [Pleurotus pulmonarius]|nr:hypothetical protein EYR40_004811 [Pleurotus pulmonarius]
MDATNPSIPEIQKLRKGEACMYCRRRKMKCDGVRPICGQCMRGDRAEDCEYAANSSYSRTQGLEDTIARMEARIRELENPDNGQGAKLVLRNPYFVNEFQQLPNSDLPVDLPIARDVQQAASSSHWWALDEPPVPMRANFVDRFLQSGVEVGFFLNANRFRQSTLRDLPLGHHERPHPVLLSAAYLWGAHLAGEPSDTQHEDAMLTRALSQLSGSLSSTHPHRIMHTIQAKVLLIHYLFANGRLLEGKYHTSSVVGLAFAARLNKVRSSEVTDTNPLPAPVDSVEEGERIRACWTIFALDKCWAVAFDSPPNAHCPTEMAGQQLDTPWPLEMAAYEQGLPSGYGTSNRTSYTLQNFLNEVPTSDSGDSALGLLAKGAILWELSTRIFHQFRAASEQTLTTHVDMFNRLDRLIDQVIAAIESVSLGRKEYILPRCVASAAAIRLHSNIANTNPLSRGKCLLAAEAIVLSLNSIPDLDSAYANPIIASAWTAASQVISGEVTLWRSAVDTVGAHEVERAERDLKRLFNAGLNVMTILAERSQLIRYQEELTQESYNALFGL